MTSGNRKPGSLAGLGVYSDRSAYSGSIGDTSNSTGTTGTTGTTSTAAQQTINVTSAQNPSSQAPVPVAPMSPRVEDAPGNQCGWFQAPNAAGQCELSVVRIGQTVFNLPSRIMAEPIMLLPGWAVPWVSLGVNLAVWYFVGGWAIGMAKDEWKRRRG